MKKASVLLGSAIATLSLVVLLASNTAFAACPMTGGACPCKPGKNTGNKEKMKEHFQKKKEEINQRLNLNEEQKEKAKALHEETKVKNTAEDVKKKHDMQLEKAQKVLEDLISYNKRAKNEPKVINMELPLRIIFE